MRCAICRRKTDLPAAWLGGFPVGPVCAKNRGLLALPVKKTPAQSQTKKADSDTFDLFTSLVAA